MPLVVLPLVVLMIAGAGIPLWLAIPLHLAAFTMAALVCHGRLAADRPAPVHLTEFYFWIAFGGMLGGVFNTLAAPLLFSRVIEYPLVLVLALAARRGRRAEAGSSWSLNDLVVPIGVGALSAGFIVWLHPGRETALSCSSRAWDCRRCLAFTQSRVPLRFAASVATMLVAGSLAANAQGQALYVSRTFFGVYRVTTDQQARYHSLFHGTTLHGMQALDPAHQGEPMTYFHRQGPIGQAFAGLPAVAAQAPSRGRGAWRRHARQLPDARTAVDVLRDRSRGRANRPHRRVLHLPPSVRRRAAASCWATRGCRWPGRPAASYGLIVLDAFSSDAIPIHLMTSEALGLYLSRLAPGGVLAFHISNRHLNLAPVLARLAVSHGLAVRLQRHTRSTTPGLFASWWMVMAKDAEDLGPLASDPRWVTPAIPPSTPLWTDDFSNILSVLNVAVP